MLPLLEPVPVALKPGEGGDGIQNPGSRTFNLQPATFNRPSHPTTCAKLFESPPRRMLCHLQIWPPIIAATFLLLRFIPSEKYVGNAAIETQANSFQLARTCKRRCNELREQITRLMTIYTACLALGLLFTIISAFAGHFFGGDHGGDVGTGGHAEAGYDHTGLPGISFFSPTVLACFITAFGACGLILTNIESTRSMWISAPISAIAGGTMAFFAFLLFNWMFQKTQSSSESRVGSLAGISASIVTPIPQDGVGEIAYVQGGTRYTAPARTETGAPVPAGKPVRITRIVGTQYFVELL